MMVGKNRLLLTREKSHPFLQHVKVADQLFLFQVQFSLGFADLVIQTGNLPADASQFVV